MTATPGTNVLTLAPSLSAARDRQCTQLLNVGPPATLDVLQITYSDSAAERVEAWLSSHDELPARLGIVDVADRASVAGDGSEELPASVAVTTANPNDITGLGMELNNYLNDLDTDCQLVVCFDSLTELLQFTDVQAAFKFLHMFTGQLRSVDAVAHFHLDPNAVDDQTVHRLKPVFDDAVRAN
ncbi:hypothetical protein [Halomicrobium sp. LC1Hm]|uniref:DUF7504 family protein n=1 Tax=Halomicrobium sp. LC1Hm TaxID=2610902 RepID=UPI0012983BD5|nr:hypothetical protein [Halomicrobium sp. LC1Hm]QGA81660.1 KaiC-like protein ATPase [Halomicrobium sp. LC1Hm]